MSNRILFVYDNLKVTLYPGDAPYFGFDILAGETQCSTVGTLYDMGHNAAFSARGNTQVRGQIWTTYSSQSIRELKEFIYPEGDVQIISTKVTITEEKDKIVIPANIFAMNKIPTFAKKIDSGLWWVRGYKL
jgi:gamma-glutamylcyclotransferase (GGCT)/AIG2-like uncharacterized protein YtfP